MGMVTTYEAVLVELDDRRRSHLGKVGHKEHTRYLVHTYPDGSMRWVPAAVVPEHELRLQRRPDILQSIESARAHPNQLVRRTLRRHNEPEVDWEGP